MTWFKRYPLLSSVVAAHLVLALFRPSLAWLSLTRTVAFLGDVLAIVPAVMVLVALLDAWVPKATVERSIGARSGVRGILLAVVLGTAAAGPLYAAFPIARSLRDKGARMANIAVFLGCWGTIKIPMILLEGSYVGVKFALLRLALTLPGVVAIGLLMERIVPAALPSRDLSGGVHVELGANG